MNRLLSIALVAVALSCAPPEPAAETVTQRSDGDGIMLSQRCTNSVDGFSVSYPEGWHTNRGEVLTECSVFDPQPVEVPHASELPFQIAVVIRVERVAVDSLISPTPWEEIHSSQKLSIEGREAWRVESRSTGEGLADRGMRTTRYVVLLGEGRTLIAATHDVNGAEYPRNQEILGRMVETLDVTSS
jgi:hypothetical protein